LTAERFLGVGVSPGSSGDAEVTDAAVDDAGAVADVAAVAAVVVG
jgi:hypothetical protein